MQTSIQLDCEGVDWKAVAAILKTVNMGSHKPEIHQKAFEASHTTVFLYHDDRLVGFGRAISDGAYQAAIYDCAVLPDYQGKGLGAIIIKTIMQSISPCNVILYASPGKERFYQKYGFRPMRTGMACFRKAQLMREHGFTD